MVTIVLPARNLSSVVVKSSVPDLRKYESIWNRIKNSRGKSCSVEVHPAMVARVRKAVIKEKYNDAVFKIEKENDYWFLKIVVSKIDRKISRMTFRLKARLGDL